MSASKILLDKYLKTCATPSDAARKLELYPSAISNWQSGRSHPDASSVQKMCNALGLNTMEWLAKIEAERAKGKENRKVWLTIAGTIAAGASLAVAALQTL